MRGRRSIARSRCTSLPSRLSSVLQKSEAIHATHTKTALSRVEDATRLRSIDNICVQKKTGKAQQPKRSCGQKWEVETKWKYALRVQISPHRVLLTGLNDQRFEILRFDWRAVLLCGAAKPRRDVEAKPPCQNILVSPASDEGRQHEYSREATKNKKCTAAKRVACTHN